MSEALFSTPSPAFIICRLSDDGHSDSFEVVPHCSFHLHFSNNYGCWTSCHVPVGHLYVFFGEMSTSVFCPFFDWVVYFLLFCFLILSCMSCLYTLEVNPSSVALFANIFSQSVGCLFILLMVSFGCYLISPNFFFMNIQHKNTRLL